MCVPNSRVHAAPPATAQHACGGARNAQIAQVLHFSKRSRDGARQSIIRHFAVAVPPARVREGARACAHAAAAAAAPATAASAAATATAAAARGRVLTHMENPAGKKKLLGMVPVRLFVHSHLGAISIHAHGSSSRAQKRVAQRAGSRMRARARARGRAHSPCSDVRALMLDGMVPDKRFWCKYLAAQSRVNTGMGAARAPGAGVHTIVLGLPSSRATLVSAQSERFRRAPCTERARALDSISAPRAYSTTAGAAHTRFECARAARRSAAIQIQIQIYLRHRSNPQQARQEGGGGWTALAGAARARAPLTGSSNF
jgi:hypothetical protein